MTPLGDGAVRLELPPEVDRAAALRAILAVPGVIDAAIAETTAAAFFEPDAPPDWGGLSWPIAAPTASVTHDVRVRYDGPDLNAVSERLAMTPEEVVRRHATEYVVRFMGFLPGFAYLGELDPALRLPRRATPRARVAPGSVAIAATKTAIYPLPSPGGWWLIGTATPDARPWFGPGGARFAVGDRVRLIAEW